MKIKGRKIFWTVLGVIGGVAAVAVLIVFLSSRPTFEVIEKSHKTTIIKGVNGKNDVLAGTVTLKINLPLNKTTSARYLMPLDSAGNPLPGAENLIFYAPFNVEAWRKPPSRPFHFYFPETLGFTIFSFTIKTTAMSKEDPRYYIYQTSGWYEVVFNFQKWLAEKYNFDHKKILITGESSGGSMAQNIGVAHPDKVEAVAWNGGALYNMEIAPSNDVAFLGLSVFGCPGVAPTMAFSEKVNSSQGRQMLQAESAPDPDELGTRNYHHSASELNYELIKTFLRDIVALRDANNGILPPPTQWPESIEQQQKVLYLPSADFAGLWRHLPFEISAYFRNVNRDKQALITVFPNEGQAGRIVFYMHDPDITDETFLQDNLHYLREKNSIVYSIELHSDYKKIFSDLSIVMENVVNDHALADLPIYVIGSGMGGHLVASAALENNSDRIVRITTFNTAYDNPFIEFSMNSRRGKSSLPLKMYYTSLFPDKPHSAPANTSIEIIDGKNNNFGKIWFSLLDEAIR